MPNDPAIKESAAVHRFNRVCVILGLIWVFAVPVGSLALRKSNQDFPQYYMGGVIAANQRWDVLYPIPTQDSKYNLGFEDASIMQPGYKALAESVGTSAMDVRFIQAPTVALMCIPLSWMKFETANVVWRVLLAGCVFGCALFARRSLEACSGKVTRLSGLLVLGVCISPLAYRVVRVGNVSAIVGLCVAAVVFDLLATRGRATRSFAPLAMVLGFFLKYATAVLTPIHLLSRQWKTPIISAIVGAAFLGFSYWYIGAEPFQRFARDVAPTLTRPHPKQANQSLQGMLLRLTHQDSLTDAQRIGITVAQFAVLAGIGALMIRIPRSQWAAPETVFAAATVLIIWLLIFGPLYWDHYPIYLVPMWGWLLWEGSKSTLARVMAIGSIALIYVPLPVFGERLNLFEPIASHMFYGTMLMFALGVKRLLQRSPAVV